MPTERRFEHFGITMATVCIPFFLLIGSLNTTLGMRFWVGKWQRLVSWVMRTPVSQDEETSDDEDETDDGENRKQKQKPKYRERSMSQLEALAARKSQMMRTSPASTIEIEPKMFVRDRGRSADLGTGTEVQMVAAKKEASQKHMEASNNVVGQSKGLNVMDKLLGRRKLDTERENVV